MRRWGSILQDVGSRRVLMISSVGFAITPFLWLFSANLWWLSLISGIRGALGAGYQLSVSTFLFDAVTPAKRARCAAYSSIINSLSIVLGSLVGGLIVSVVPRVDGLGAATLKTDSSILLLFVLSGIIHVTTLAFFTSFKEVREVKHRPTTSILLDLAFLRPFGAVSVRMGNGKTKSESSQCR
jgi:MFS family permease